MQTDLKILLNQLRELHRIETHMKLFVDIVESPSTKMLSILTTQQIINLIYTLPDGQKTFSINYQKTECSSCINNILFTNDKCCVFIRSRGLLETQK